MTHDAKAIPRRGAFAAGIFQLSLLCVLACLAAGCAPRAAMPPARQLQGIYHVVRTGENLYRIGRTYGVSHQELARVNRLRDADHIRLGQRIFIPGATQQLPAEVITQNGTREATPIPEVAEQRFPYSPQDRLFIWPLSGTINSAFGPRGSSFHDGIDIGAPEGTPIHAIEAGEVIYSDQLRGYGNIVIVRHADGFASVYAHNEKNLVREGQQVSRGETVARVGSTGRVTGPHLHFEIRRNNTAQDPLRFLPRLCCAAASNRVSPDG